LKGSDFFVTPHDDGRVGGHESVQKSIMPFMDDPFATRVMSFTGCSDLQSLLFKSGS